MQTWILYGAYGYTGELIARAAVQSGLQPVLSGRSREPLARLANELGLAYRVVDLNDSAALDTALSDAALVLNCAGPFKRSAKPLLAACLRTKTHYLDLAGEVPEFQYAQQLDDRARAQGVMLLPGVGFGVVPTDALAVALKAQLPSATQLELAFQTEGGVSRGTLSTVLNDLPNPGVVRQNNQLVPARAGSSERRIEHAGQQLIASLNPWRGDLITAAHSTGIPNITTYAIFPGALRGLVRVSRWLGWLMRSRPFQRVLQALLKRQPAGPTPEQRASGSTFVWGEVQDSRTGQRISASLSGPEAYDYTALTAIACVQHALNQTIKPGFQTPASVFGASALLALPGVTVYGLQQRQHQEHA